MVPPQWDGSKHQGPLGKPMDPHDAMIFPWGSWWLQHGFVWTYCSPQFDGWSSFPIYIRYILGMQTIFRQPHIVGYTCPTLYPISDVISQLNIIEFLLFIVNLLSIPYFQTTPHGWPRWGQTQFRTLSQATTEVLPPWQPWANNYDWTMQTPYVGPVRNPTWFSAGAFLGV